MTALYSALLVLAAVQAAQQGQAPPAQQQQVRQVTAPPRESGANDELWSLGRIRRQLEIPQTVKVIQPVRNLPRYRVEVTGHPFQLRDWREGILVPRSGVDVPLGGSDYYDMMRLITPQDVAAVANRDALGLATSAAVSSLAVRLITKGIQAYKNREPRRAREEVLQELADIAAHNAQVAAEEERKKKKIGGDGSQ